MPITVDELFAEDFKPEWMTHRERIARELRTLEELAAQRSIFFAARKFNDYTGRAIDRKFALAAARSRQRIADRCDVKGNYSNGLFKHRHQAK